MIFSMYKIIIENGKVVKIQFPEISDGSPRIGMEIKREGKLFSLHHGNEKNKTYKDNVSNLIDGFYPDIRDPFIKAFGLEHTNPKELQKLMPNIEIATS